MMLKKSATLKDVAKLAGVSTATVARVLHNQGYIADETRKLVESALQTTGYRLNVVAQGLRTQRTMLIGHLLHSIAPNPFFAGVALGAEQEALSHSWSVLMLNMQGDPQRERQGVETLMKRRVAAILFTTPVDQANVCLAQEAGLVVIQVERPTALPTHSVIVDNYAGSVAATEYLLGLGHRRIAYIGGDPGHTRSGRANPQERVEEERLSGFLDTLQAHGITVESSLITQGRYFSLEDSGLASDGYKYMKQLLQLHPRPTAVFATCDMLAAGALQALYEEGLKVPADMSVIGFDDTYAPYLSPPLTTVQQPMADIGKEAVRIVLEVFEEDTEHAVPYKQVRLPTRLMIRSSTGPAPAIS